MLELSGDRLSRFKSCLNGLAVGDALGMPFEGWSSEKVQGNWVSLDFEDCECGISGKLLRGSYTDDTLMTIQTCRSLIERGRIDPQDMARKFIEWFDLLGNELAYRSHNLAFIHHS